VIVTTARHQTPLKQFQYYKLLPPTPDHTKLAWRGLSQMDFVAEQNTRSVPYSVTSIGSHPHETKLSNKTRHAAVIIFLAVGREMGRQASKVLLLFR